MLVKNISTRTISLSFVQQGLTLAPNQEVSISDSFVSHPQFKSLLNQVPPVIQVTGLSDTTSDSALSNLPTTRQKQALDNAANPSNSNPYETSSAVRAKINEHIGKPNAHHDNSNDPSRNEKQALANSQNASGNNPFITQSSYTSQTNSAFADHILNFDHTPTPLTPDEVASIQAATAPSAVNPMVTVSFQASQLAAQIGAHAADADAHHDNSNDPTADEKLAMTNANSPAAANPFITNTDFTAHTSVATAHHSNANDPTADEKAALSNSSSPNAGNPFITDSAADTKIAGQIATHTADPDAHHDNSNDPTADQKAALDGAGTPSALNPYTTDSDVDTIVAADIASHAAIATAHHSNANDPSANEKDAMSNANAPAAANPFLTGSDLTAHTAIATAHHSNANDPTSDEKDAMTNSASPAAANPFQTQTAVSSSISTHASNATAHHSNVNDPTTDQKAALDGANSPAAGNVFLTQNDERLADVRLQFNSATVVDLVGVKSKQINVNGEIIDVSSTISVDLSTDNTIDATGADTASTPAASTLHYVYVSNSSASPFPSDLRLSTVAPSFDATQKAMVLGGTGNAAEWKFVGWVNTDGSSQVADKYALASFYNPKTETLRVTGTGTQGPAASNDTYEILTGLAQDVLLPVGWLVRIHASVPVQATNTGTDITLGATDGSTDLDMCFEEIQVATSDQALVGEAVYEETIADSYDTFSVQHKYSDVTGSLANKASSVVYFSRIPN